MLFLPKIAWLHYANLRKDREPLQNNFSVALNGACWNCLLSFIFYILLHSARVLRKRQKHISTIPVRARPELGHVMILSVPTGNGFLTGSSGIVRRTRRSECFNLWIRTKPNQSKHSLDDKRASGSSTLRSLVFSAKQANILGFERHFFSAVKCESFICWWKVDSSTWLCANNEVMFAKRSALSNWAVDLFWACLCLRRGWTKRHSQQPIETRPSLRSP